MGLQSAMTTSLTGLQAAETTIDVVGNNIANSNTVGFKESNTIFATQFLQTLSIGSAPNANNGGTNPRQIGLGVKVAQIATDFTQGTIEISSNPLDLAIQGDGFLIVQSGTDRLYTRNGQLQLNSQNEVVTSTGQRVLGYGVDDNYELTSQLEPLAIDLGSERVAQRTENAVFSGVLNPAVDLGAVPEIIQSNVLGDGNVEQPAVINNGANTTVSADQPSQATGATVAGATGPATGTLSYRLVFLDNNGLEGKVSPAFSVAHDTAGGNSVEISDIDLPNSPWTGVAIYRRNAGDGEYYKVGETANASDTDFVDDVSDANLTSGDQLDATNIEAGNYNYYVTFYDPLGNGVETRPTQQFNGEAISAQDGGRIRINLDDISVPNESRFTHMRIYRNLSDNQSDFRLVGTVPSQIDAVNYQSSFVDNVTDAALVNETHTLNLDGPPANDGTLLTDIVRRSGETYVSPFQVGTLTFGAEKSGAAIEPKTFDVTATSTVSDLLNFMQDALGIDTTSDLDSVPFGAPTADVDITSDGRIQVISNMGEQNAIGIPQTAFQLVPEGSPATSPVTLNFSATQKADGPGTSTEFTVYDSLGLPIDVRITTVLESKNGDSTSYRWYATSPDNEPVTGETTVVGDGILTFDNNGFLIPPVQTPQLTILRSQTASESPLGVALDFSAVKSLGETDAQGNPISSLGFTSQDGFAPGVLTNFNITDDGLIQGQFSNGTTRTVGQIAMARFVNNTGLQQVGDSLFNVGVNSGPPNVGRPGEGGIGTLTAGAVELSNTDIGQNLIELILASTQYRSGSRVITTAQELLDELLALRR